MSSDQTRQVTQLSNDRMINKSRSTVQRRKFCFLCMAIMNYVTAEAIRIINEGLGMFIAV